MHNAYVLGAVLTILILVIYGSQLFHTLAFFASLNTATLSNLTPVNDQIWSTNPSGQFLPPNPYRIEAIYAGGTTINRAQIQTPWMRQVLLPDVAPVQQGATIPTLPGIVYYYGGGPQPPQLDPLQIFASNAAGGAENDFAFLFASDMNTAMPQGQRMTMQFTAAVTGSTGTWTNGPMTFSQVLPNGTYVVGGMDIFGTNLGAARLVFTTGGWRPGVLARNSVVTIPSPLFRSGALGEYGRFLSTSPPSLDTFALGANTVQTGFLDLIKIG